MIKFSREAIELECSSLQLHIAPLFEHLTRISLGRFQISRSAIWGGEFRENLAPYEDRQKSQEFCIWGVWIGNSGLHCRSRPVLPPPLLYHRPPQMSIGNLHKKKRAFQLSFTIQSTTQMTENCLSQSKQVQSSWMFSPLPPQVSYTSYSSLPQYGHLISIVSPPIIPKVSKGVFVAVFLEETTILATVTAGHIVHGFLHEVDALLAFILLHSHPPHTHKVRASQGRLCRRGIAPPHLPSTGYNLYISQTTSSNLRFHSSFHKVTYLSASSQFSPHN